MPEIALTEQWSGRIRDRLDFPVAVLHSGLSEQQRLREWLTVQRGTARVIVGTRSAVWAPCADLGLVIVDEEHDSSYKQADSLRYSARDTAIVRAQHLGIPIVLGTATPSLEAFANCERGRYQLLRLPERAARARPPKVQIIDLRRQETVGGLAVTLLREVEARIDRREQSLLFVNRRGYAPAVLCHNCGWSAQCSRCSTRLVYHKNENLLICHHCGKRQPWRAAPGCCDAPEPVAIGAGTERVEETLRRLLPDARIARIDRDSMRGRDRLSNALAAIDRQEIDILIGTQMLSKGHHFPAVTLVGILDADSRLYSIDFRAAEHLAQQIIQVGGRAGRAAKPGVVFIETHFPHHPLLQILLARGYDGFASDALVERKEAGQPPFACWALLRAEAAGAAVPQRFLDSVSAGVRSLAGPGVTILGPVPAPMERRAGRHRWQLLICAKSRSGLRHMLGHVQEFIDTLDSRRTVRWSLDVDPLEMS